MTDTNQTLLQTSTEVAEIVATETRKAKSKRRIEFFVSVLTVFALAGLWQVSSYVFPTKSAQLSGVSSPLVPGWPWVFEHALPGIAAYGGNGGGLTAAQGGANGSLLGAIQTLAQSSLVTWLRLFVGYLAGALIGFGGAVLIAWSRTARLFLALPAHMLRTLPALAMIPLVQVWFGVTFTGMVFFVAYGIGVILFAGTVNAIENVPRRYIESARTLGASPLRVYRTIVLPAIFPEVRSSLVLSLALAWSVVVGAEFLGAQSGLGYIEVQAYQFALLGRMFVVALCFLVYAAVTYVMFNLVTRPMVRWMPNNQNK